MIDQQKMLVQSAFMNGKDGNDYNVIVKEFKTDSSVDDSVFRFDPGKHEGIQIIDMR